MRDVHRLSWHIFPSFCAGAEPGALASNPLMLGLSGGDYVRSAVRAVRPGDLEAALLCLPFTDALRLLGRLSQWLASGAQARFQAIVLVDLLLTSRNAAVSAAAHTMRLLCIDTAVLEAVEGCFAQWATSGAASRALRRPGSLRETVVAAHW